MRIEKERMLLYAVTDRAWTGQRTLEEQVEAALKGGVTIVQLREKHLDDDAFLEEAIRVKQICDRFQVPLIINDRADIALKCGAAGVHVGQEDEGILEVRRLAGDKLIVGVSAHNVEEALKAQEQGADYLGVGAVFGSATKTDAKPLDKGTLRAITQAVSIPVVAIGGITRENLPKLSETGIDGVALVSAIFAAKDITRECQELLTETQKVIGKREKNMKTTLSIAGSDSCGGAGIQADLKTMTMNGVYGMTAITALTAQNTLGVRDILEVTPDFLKAQIDAVFEDIRPDAVKIGMVASAELIRVIAERLRFYQAGNVIVDPVMVATSGARLLKDDALEMLTKELLPLARVITPNIPEAQILSGKTISDAKEMEAVAGEIREKYGCAVLLKGGHSINDANDLLCDENGMTWFNGRRIENPNTHGTGCTLSSAIASNLAKGYSLEESIRRAKEYIAGALEAMLDLGRGSGPMQHNFNLTGKYAEHAKKG